MSTLPAGVLSDVLSSGGVSELVSVSKPTLPGPCVLVPITDGDAAMAVRRWSTLLWSCVEATA
jgi:hypothetical protein